MRDSPKRRHFSVSQTHGKRKIHFMSLQNDSPQHGHIDHDFCPKCERVRTVETLPEGGFRFGELRPKEEFPDEILLKSLPILCEHEEEVRHYHCEDCFDIVRVQGKTIGQWKPANHFPLGITTTPKEGGCCSPSCASAKRAELQASQRLFSYADLVLATG